MLWDMSDQIVRHNKKVRIIYRYQSAAQMIGVVRAEEKTAIAERPGFITGNSEMRKIEAKQNARLRDEQRKKIEAQMQVERKPLSSEVEMVRACPVVENPAIVRQNQKMYDKIKAKLEALYAQTDSE